MIRLIDKDQNNDFNKYSNHPLQTCEWGEFRKGWGNEVVKFQIGSGENIKSIQVIFSKIPHTNFKIGTVLKSSTPSKELIDELKVIGEKENAVFIKLEPGTGYLQQQSSERGKQTKNLIKLGLVEGKTLFTPTTFWIDLTKSEDQLLKSFHPKTRYNIRYAQKQGVEVVEDNTDEAFENYLKLTKETMQRQGFYAHSEKYHRLMWKHLHTKPITNGQKPIARLLVAKYNQEIITAWIVFTWKDFLYYPYGASTDKYKNVQSNSLMMWGAIKFGKKLGLKTFDLWGREEGKGFTKFKEGFNPQVVEFLGSWDLVTNPLLYKIYKLSDSIRWKILRFKNKLTKPTF